MKTSTVYRKGSANGVIYHHGPDGPGVNAVPRAHHRSLFGNQSKFTLQPSGVDCLTIDFIVNRH